MFILGFILMLVLQANHITIPGLVFWLVTSLAIGELLLFLSVVGFAIYAAYQEL